MSGESLSRWLALREPADRAARSLPLTRTVIDRLATARPVQVLDLGAGAGSNLRYVAPRLARPQRWLLVDCDETLLREGTTHAPTWDGPLTCEVETRRLDLVTLDHAEIFAGRHLVTASALLDLVSEDWLRALAARCRELRAAALFALTYNGQSCCSPAEPEDDEIRQLINQHQRSDKGLGGVAAGPNAADCAERCFTVAGYGVGRESSDWVLQSEQCELQRQLIRGWAHAAGETDPARQDIIGDWMARRLAHVDAGRSHIIVGHDDLAMWPP